MPWNNKANDYQIRDDLSWTRGAHQLKFGFSWALYKKVQDAFANTEGNFNFNGSFTSPQDVRDRAPYLADMTLPISFWAMLSNTPRTAPRSPATGITFPRRLMFRTTGA